MASGTEYPLGASRHVDIPSIAGFGLSAAGFTALVGELVVRGWWGFATSGWDLLIILGKLAASGWLSWWAYGWTEGWPKALAALGIGLSVIAFAVAVALLAFRVLVENTDLVDGNSKRRNNRSGSKRRLWS